MSDSIDPLVQIRLSDLLSLKAAVGSVARPLHREETPLPKPTEPAPSRSMPEYLNTRDAAAFLGISTKCLEAWRSKGEGPPFTHVGRAVRYPIAQLRAWIASKP